MNSKLKTLHWPSLFLFLMAAIAAVTITDDETAALLQVIGFIFMGYASIRLVPADLFTQKTPLMEVVKSNKTRRQIDVVLLLVGVVAITASLLIKYVFVAV